MWQLQPTATALAIAAIDKVLQNEKHVRILYTVAK